MVKMDEKEVAISYETLFEMLRREKNREDLQKLDPSFFGDTFEYLNGLHAQLRQKHTEGASDEAIELVQLQMHNIKKILRDLYGRREKKIVHMAVIMSRTRNTVVSTDALLESEQRLFSALQGLLQDHKQEQLGALAGSPASPATPTPVVSPTSPAPSTPSIESPQEVPNPSENTPETSPQTPSKELALNISEKDDQSDRAEPAKTGSSETGQTKPTLISLKFLEEVQKFVGPNLEIYGPYQQGDVAELPSMVANILVEKQKAQHIETEQTEITQT